MFSRFIHISVFIQCFHHSVAEEHPTVWKNHIFMHLSTDGHFHYFCFQTLRDNALWTFTYTFLNGLCFQSCRSGIDDMISVLPRLDKTIFQSCCALSHSHQGGGIPTRDVRGSSFLPVLERLWYCIFGTIPILTYSFFGYLISILYIFWTLAYHVNKRLW